MSTVRWERLREMLDRVLDSPETRDVLLAEYEAESPELCGELRRMLRDLDEDEEPRGILELLSPDFSGQMVGPYRIVRELGRGGMGTVFLAVREDADVCVNVALKFLRQDLLSGVSGRRFRAERRALARLNHPNIARLLDWGTVSGGMLYLVMEYVDGAPITQHAAQHHLNLAARLDLFAEVCAAVQHAHQNLVVHRDLKPTNILVTPSGSVKLLDFGIAAQLDSTTVLATCAGMTLGYASPEQIRGDAVTVSTDVYSLGLVLYELLAGQNPHDRAGGVWNAAAADPALPSRRARLAEVPARELAGDLDAIVLKALRQEPAQRYPSVEALASDIRRFREGRPIHARHGSRRYVAARFLRRNRLNAGLAACAAVALAAGAGVAVWKWREAERNYAVAQRNYQTLRDFARDVIAGVDAKTATSATDAQRRMSQAAARYLQELKNGRLDDEDLQLEIAAAYLHLGEAQGEFMNPNEGDPVAALENFRNAYAIYLTQWQAHHDEWHGALLLKACNDVTPIIADPAAAVEFSRRAKAVAEELLARYPDAPGALHESAMLYGGIGQRVRSTGDLPDALAGFRRAVEIARHALQLHPNDAAALNAAEAFLSETGSTLRREGELSKALEMQTEARGLSLRELQARPGARSRRQAAFKLIAMAETLRQLKRYPEAADCARQSLEELRAISLDDPANEQAKADLSLAWYRLGDIQSDQHQAAAANASHQEALRLRREGYAHHPGNLQAARNLLSSLLRLGLDRDLAIELGTRVVKAMPSDVYAAADLARAYGADPKAVDLWADVLRRCPQDKDLAALAARSH